MSESTMICLITQDPMQRQRHAERADSQTSVSIYTFCFVCFSPTFCCFRSSVFCCLLSSIIRRSFCMMDMIPVSCSGLSFTSSSPSSSITYSISSNVIRQKHGITRQWLRHWTGDSEAAGSNPDQHVTT